MQNRRPVEQDVAATYDQFAAAYATDNEANAFNALYERPAMLALLGDVSGRRVLDAGCGAGALSTHHPAMDWQLAGGSYFETRLITETWRKGGKQATVTFWRRPLTAMVAAFRASGFVIEDIVEPTPVAECAERFPEDYAKLTTAPRFLFVRLGKPHRA